MNELQELLIQKIVRFTAESPANRLVEIDGSPIFDEPLVGFARGDDPLFEMYRRVIGDFHLTPRQVLDVQAGAALSVVVWVLPIARKTRHSNRDFDQGCSLRWNHTRFAGEDFNDDLRRYVTQVLADLEIRAAAPVLSNAFKQVNQMNGPSSTWSERHAAYAAGLGTFSLSDGLITARGIAHRVGSVVCAAEFDPTPRPYEHYLEYCRFYARGTCGKCIKRCPAGAISAAGHDKIKCEQYLFQTLKAWTQKPGYMGEKYIGCGLCQTGVPCEQRIPR